MHGARGGHGPDKANPGFIHGMRGQKWVDLRKAISELVREGREIAGL